MGSGWKHMNSEDARKNFVQIYRRRSRPRTLGVKTLIVTWL